MLLCAAAWSLRPYGWALWENIQQALDRRFKAADYVNAAFPLLIPRSFIDKEQSHVAGFSPELAVVTIGGGEEARRAAGDDPPDFRDHHRPRLRQMDTVCAICPCSSINGIAWCAGNYVPSFSCARWKFTGRRATPRTPPSTKPEAVLRQMLEIYTDFAINEAAVPVIPGRKSASERFAGADQTYSIEAMMGDCKALQAGTSHNLGQNFAKVVSTSTSSISTAMAFCNIAGRLPGVFPRDSLARLSWFTATIKS